MVIENLSANFHLRTEITKVNRGVLLTLTNPEYKDILTKYNHLKGMEIDDVHVKRELPVHLILRTSEYARIKTETTPKMGKPGEPIAELTRFGWTLMSPGSEPDLTKMFYRSSLDRKHPPLPNNKHEFEALGPPDEKVEEAARHVAKV